MKHQRLFILAGTCIAAMALAAGMGGCNTKGSHEDGETDGDGWDDADTDQDPDGETESCYPLPDDCPPLDRRCAEDGRVEQCREDGSGWDEATEQCGAEQHCDTETAECLCDAGYIPVLGEGTCLRVGPECTDGFEPDGEGGCAPMLDECEDDEIQVIGGGCVQVGEHGDCGTGDFGNIPDEAGTEYVNTAYGGGDSNGTMDRPFRRRVSWPLPPERTRRCLLSKGPLRLSVVAPSS